ELLLAEAGDLLEQLFPPFGVSVLDVEAGELVVGEAKIRLEPGGLLQRLDGFGVGAELRPAAAREEARHGGPGIAGDGAAERVQSVLEAIELIERQAPIVEIGIEGLVVRPVSGRDGLRVMRE